MAVCEDSTIADWPADGLENVSSCPICGSARRESLYRNLTDDLFYCAAGKWNMYRCCTCGSAYLDPRPTQDTIGMAYDEYFTHHERPDFASLSFLGKLNRKLANGYRNYRYGTRNYPATRVGILAAGVSPNRRAALDAGMRHVPRASKGMRLLDVGCGNSVFLSHARSAGWDVVGVDFDPIAVAAAKRDGLDVRLGGIDILDPAEGLFDYITLAHAIEHLHNPRHVLTQCFDLLKSGGAIWIDTPNIESLGHYQFGRHWRGLEPPRHLVIFSVDSLRDLLGESGFSVADIQPYRRLCREVFGASGAINSNDQSLAKRRSWSELIRRAEKIAKNDPRKREFITLQAWKR